MKLEGNIVQVVLYRTGDYVEVAAGDGDTRLYLSNVSEFHEEGGTALLDDTKQIITYSGYNDEESYLELLTPIEGDVEVNGFVSVLPESVEKRASVLIAEGDEPIEARVPFEMMTILQEGIRTDDTGYESVSITDDEGDFVVQYVLGEPAKIDASMLDPATKVPVEALTDGEPPTEAPVVVAAPFAVAAVQAEWAPVDNPDPIVGYEVAASLTSPVAEDGSQTVLTTSATTARVADLGGVAIPMDGSAVYLKVRALDGDGPGPWSTEVSAIPRAADAFITAAFIAAIEIEAQQILAGSITADLGILGQLNVGGYVEIDGERSSITIYQDLDHQIPLVQLDHNGSVFRGTVEADTISTLKGLVLLGDASQIASGAGQTLMGGIADPSAKPTVVPTLLQSTWPPVPSGFQEKGIAWDPVDSIWIRLTVPTSGNISGRCRVDRIDQNTGAIISSVLLGNILGIGEDDFSGITRLGDYYFSMALDTYSGHWWYLTKFSATDGSFVARSSNYTYDQENRPGVGYGTSPSSSTVDVGFFQAGRLKVWQYDIDSLSATTQIFDSGDNAGVSWNPGYPYNISSVVWVSTDSIVVDSGSRMWRFSRNTTTNRWARNAAEDIFLQTPMVYGGVARKTSGPNTGFYSTHSTGRLFRYSSYVSSVHFDVMVAYTETDGIDSTASSPQSRFVGGFEYNGRYLQVSLPPAPPGAGIPQIFATTPGFYPGDAPREDLLRRVSPITGRTLTFDPSVFGSPSQNPPESSTFSQGSPGWIKSAYGGLALYGDGTIEVPDPLMPNHAVSKRYVDDLSQEDTGWVNWGYLSGWDDTTVGQLQYRKYGKIVQIRGGAYRSAGVLAAGTRYVPATDLPSEFCPSQDVKVASTGTSTRPTAVQLDPDGKIYISKSDAVSGNVQWVDCGMTYLLD